MKTVTIAGVDYPAYADLEEANAYMGGDASAYGTAWRDAEEDDQMRALVTATRAIDAAKWKGVPTAPPHAFPRSGLEYADGSPVDPATTPQQVIDGSILLASWYIEGTDIQNAANAASNTKRLKADTVELEYFKNLNAVVGKDAVFPNMVLALLGLWMEATGGGVPGLGSAKSFGTCRPSHFKIGYKPVGGY